MFRNTSAKAPSKAPQTISFTRKRDRSQTPARPPAFSSVTDLGLGLSAASASTEHLSPYRSRGRGRQRSQAEPESPRLSDDEMFEERKDPSPERVAGVKRKPVESSSSESEGGMSDVEAIPKTKAKPKKKRAVKKARQGDSKAEVLKQYGLTENDPAKPIGVVNMPSSLTRNDEGETNTQAIVNYAKDKAPLADMHQAGVQFVEEQHLEQMGEELSYAGARARQVLHQHSEVMRWALEKAVNPHADPSQATEAKRAAQNRRRNWRKRIKDAEKKGNSARVKQLKENPPAPVKTEFNYKPVEVQSSYLVGEDGEPTMAVSANQQSSQAFLANLSQERLMAIYHEAAQIDERDEKNAHIRRAAQKILTFAAQDKYRRENQVEDYPESEADLALAAKLARKALTRSEHTVVLNIAKDANKSGARHAEQVLAEHYVNDPASEDGAKFEAAGTRIRCAACSVDPKLRFDETLHRLHGRDEAISARDEGRAPHAVPYFVGIFHAGNATQENARGFVDAAERGEAKMDKWSDKRQRSPSPVRGRYAPPDDEEDL